MARNKVKARKAQESRRRKAEKRAKKKKVLTKERNQNSLSAQKRLKLLIQKFRDSPEYMFWVAHGLNMLASKYEEGLWEPVFPDIYEGRDATEAEIAAYLKRHFDEESKTWTPEGRRAVGWACSPPTNIYAIQQKSVAEAEKNGVDPKIPACGPVWRIFQIMSDEIEKRMGNQHLTQQTAVEP